jgi:hypothetical protein
LRRWPPKFCEHLSLAEAKALQDDATAKGVMLLIYEERPYLPKPKAKPEP